MTDTTTIETETSPGRRRSRFFTSSLPEAQSGIAFLIVGSLCLTIFVLVFRPIPAAADSDLLKIIVGGLLTQSAAIIQYFFGSSRSGSASSEAVRKIATGESPGPQASTAAMATAATAAAIAAAPAAAAAAAPAAAAAAAPAAAAAAADVSQNGNTTAKTET